MAERGEIPDVLAVCFRNVGVGPTHNFFTGERGSQVSWKAIAREGARQGWTKLLDPDDIANALVAPWLGPEEVAALIELRHALPALLERLIVDADPDVVGAVRRCEMCRRVHRMGEFPEHEADCPVGAVSAALRALLVGEAATAAALAPRLEIFACARVLRRLAHEGHDWSVGNDHDRGRDLVHCPGFAAGGEESGQ